MEYPRGKLLLKGVFTRQSPLPLPFHNCWDAFTNLVQYFNERIIINGLSFGNLTIEVTHLQYVDDTLLCCSWNVGNFMAWWSIAKLFLLGLGLSLNVPKQLH